MLDLACDTGMESRVFKDITSSTSSIRLFYFFEHGSEPSGISRSGRTMVIADCMPVEVLEIVARRTTCRVNHIHDEEHHHEPIRYPKTA